MGHSKDASIFSSLNSSSEVLKALLKTRDLFESWRLGQECLASENGGDAFLRTAEEQEWATTELRNSLRSIEWDLEVSLSVVAFGY